MKKNITTPHKLLPIIISGNGPSLAQIDYHRLPQQFDTFRCNQFFCEEKYYLGKKVTGYFVGNPTAEVLYNTSAMLEQKKEYFFHKHYYSHLFFTPEQNHLKDKFYYLTLSDNICFSHKKIKKILCDHYTSYGLVPTTGILMILTAIAMGYTEIYVTGIDLYQGESYAYPIDPASKIVSLLPSYIKTAFDSHHSLEFEKTVLEFIKELSGITIYSISPGSLLTDIFPLAPIQNDKPYTPQDKPKNYINDVIFPVEISKQIEKGRSKQKWECIRSIPLLRFFFNFMKLPYKLLKTIVKFLTNKQ